MNWTTPAQLRAQVQRLWDRGELLRASTSDAFEWPIRLSLKGPGAADLSDRFEAVRHWVRSIADMPRLRIEWRQWNHRVQGAQQLPGAVWLDSLEQALAIIGKQTAAREFQSIWSLTETQQPALLAWLHRRPLQALEMAARWPRLMAIVGWLQMHPRPNVYLRQVDVPGVDSKFIEAHRGVLAELLDLALAPEAIDATALGAGLFTRRYGFLDKPVRIRFRLLDPELPSLPGVSGCACSCGRTGSVDITLDEESFAALTIPVQQVFITENETNFLAFPQVERALVIFGAGYGWQALARAHWLHRCATYYWGDIDTHGFAILDLLRAHFPHARSMLMDRETLHAHRLQWGEESDPQRRDLQRLTADEAALYDALRFDQIRPALRLEQERVSYHRVLAALSGVRGSPVQRAFGA